MKKNLFKIAIATAAMASAATVGHAHNHGHSGHSMAAPKTNIVEAAVATPDLSTLVTAVKAAGLVDTLASPGPFTVFAPTNAAFGKLPAGTPYRSADRGAAGRQEFQGKNSSCCY